MNKKKLKNELLVTRNRLSFMISASRIARSLREKEICDLKNEILNLREERIWKTLDDFPKESGYYLVTLFQWSSGKYSLDMAWFDSTNNRWSKIAFGEIAYWMKAPKLPEKVNYG